MKIGHLSISAEANQANNDNIQAGEGSGQGGDGGSDSGSTSGDANASPNDQGHQGKGKGPWKRVHHSAQAEVAPAQPEPPKVVANTATGGGGYVAPALRSNRMTSSGPSKLRGSNKAPDIHNDEFFPSLSTSKPDASGRK